MATRILSWIMIVLAMSIFVLFFKVQVADGVRQIYLLAFPCSLPVTYKLGSVDPRFGISTSTLEKDLAKASGLWNDASGKKLISEDKKNALVTVSLVYDSRQEMTQRLRKLGITISDDRASYDSLKARYDALYERYIEKKQQFQSDLSTFNGQRDDYQKQVEYWNQKGGAPKSEFQKLQQEQQSLQERSALLKQQQDSLNSTAQEVNDLANALNQLIAALNLDVKRYNTTGQENGSSFEQGLYQRELGVETITIFEYENNNLLVRVLAHELGHALGLDHVKDAEAIMYYLNQGEAIALTKSDIGELKSVCRL